jgi:hypothetical protein
MIAMIDTVKHENQRYNTVGDWLIDENDPKKPIQIFVSEMGNEDYEFLVGVHELIEAYICKKRGIEEVDVSTYDIAFEAGRAEGNYDEPGNHPLAPYFNEHAFATKIEKQIAAELGVDWEAYDKTVCSL